MPTPRFYVRDLVETGGRRRPEGVTPGTGVGVRPLSGGQGLIRTWADLGEQLTSEELDAVCSAHGMSRAALEAAGVPGVGVEPLFDQRFDSYQSTSELHNNTDGLGQWRNQQDISLDATEAPAGGPSGSMLYTYPDLTEDPDRCDDRYITSGLNWPANTTEVWVEIVVKFMEGFTTASPSAWSCPGANDLKFVYITHQGAGEGGMPSIAYASTVGLNTNSFRLRLPSDATFDGDVFSSRAQSELFNGEWVRFRFHARLPTEPNSDGSTNDGSADGLYRLWWDDTLEIELTNISTAASAYQLLLLGQNMNQGQDSPQRLWWNRIRAWTTDPGWGA